MQYFQLITKDYKDEKRLEEINSQRTENSKIVTRLLEQLEI